MGHFVCVFVCINKQKKGKVLYVSHNEATSNANGMFVGLIVSGDEEIDSTAGFHKIKLDRKLQCSPHSTLRTGDNAT